ncbi:uncharacterized protein LOC9301446 [Arabidopsis lyrata subsp. lyrata]|uniref:uncharacterized protein LOC9301446 n=1 Tax=Arabidopsis lyrata subsp. lyrata TaxID=81972 RepID=UPI000A29B8FD|nr:uncharacterized protein LOC9301446 [Arabidopsis lyrata subsp. lyrata]|eukprot:XP_020871502.1 uncharacterized protein LOC9301446 [Arabidopsis lyrata subsp. lyrata]
MISLRMCVSCTLKGGRADWLIEKCTELGASSVTPLLTERSSIISENRVDRLERVSFAVATQCQRLHQIVLNPPIKFVTLLDHLKLHLFSMQLTPQQKNPADY